MHAQINVEAYQNDFDLSLTRTLVPLKDMSESHLLVLLAEAELEAVCSGQTLVEVGSFDGEHLYLLHGDVAMINSDGTRVIIKGGETLFPIAHHQPRQCTLMAASDCSVLRINSERLDKLLTWSQVADYLQLNIARQRDLDEDVEWMTTILKSNLFFKVPPLNVEQIFARLKPQIVYRGDVIIRQGERGEQCYFIKEGEAEVTRNVDGKRESVAIVGVGRCFGEDALVNETVRNASVLMRTDGVLIRLEKQDFCKLLKEPQVATLGFADLVSVLNDGAICVDVRSEEEYSQAHLAQAVNVPLNILAIKSRLLNKDKLYLFYCDTGRRSRAAAHLLAQQGYNALALGECSQLFSKEKSNFLLSDTNNYVLRDGVAVLGQA